MPAYNPPPQVLFSPVSNYYQGKAIRQQLAAGEQDQELKGLQMEQAKMEIAQAPERWAMAKKEAESKQESFDLALEQAKKDGKWSDLQRSAQVLIPWVQEIGEIAGQDGANSDKAMAQANQTSAQMIEALSGVVSEDQIGALQEFAGSDKQWQPEEFLNLGKYLQSFMAKDEGYTLADKAQRYENGVMVAENEGEPDAPLVTIDQTGETSATKAYGGTVGARAGDRDDKAFATYADDTNLNSLELALERGARSGFGEDVILDVRGALDTLGLVQFPDGAVQSEVVRSIGNQLALRMRNPKSGLGLTGNTSNKDLQFLKDSVAGIGRSEGGNRLLVKMAKKQNQFKRDIAAKQSQIIMNNGGVVPVDLDGRLMTFANGYEMFTKTERDEISSFANGTEDKPAVIEDESDDDILTILGL